MHKQVKHPAKNNGSDSPLSEITEKQLGTQSVSETSPVSPTDNNISVSNPTASETTNMPKAENSSVSPVSVINPQNDSLIRKKSDNSLTDSVLDNPKPNDNDTDLSSSTIEKKPDCPEQPERSDESAPIAENSHSSIPNENESKGSLHQPKSNPQPSINSSPRPRERVKNNAEGHITSEPVSDNSDDPYARSNLSEIGAGVAVVGGVVTIGGVIVGSTFVTALGVTAVVIGGTCYFLEGK